MKKTTYSKPKLTRHGSVEALTRGSSSGNILDAAFPTGTPFSQLTFS
jgi:hypothetical protein